MRWQHPQTSEAPLGGLRTKQRGGGPLAPRPLHLPSPPPPATGLQGPPHQASRCEVITAGQDATRELSPENNNYDYHNNPNS